MLKTSRFKAPFAFKFPSVFDAWNGVRTDSQRSQNGVRTKAEWRETRVKTGSDRLYTVKVSKKTRSSIVHFIYGYLVYIRRRRGLFNT